ncbi:MAG: response regulator transcription factor [Sandaracinaceae bacterium]
MQSGQVRRSSEPMPSVLIVEDDDLVARAFARQMREHVRVERAATLDDGARLARTRRFAGAVLDVHLPDGSGLELLAALRASGERLPVLIATGVFQRDVARKSAALDASCVFKPDLDGLVETFAARAAEAFRHRAEAEADAVAMLGESLRLTSRETELLALLVRGERGRELARRTGVSENTLKTRVRRLLEKFEESSLEAVGRTILEEMLHREA